MEKIGKFIYTMSLYIYLYISESLLCTPGTLKINYASIKKKKKGHKKTSQSDFTL